MNARDYHNHFLDHSFYILNAKDSFRLVNIQISNNFYRSLLEICCFIVSMRNKRDCNEVSERPSSASAYKRFLRIVLIKSFD